MTRRRLLSVGAVLVALAIAAWLVGGPGLALVVAGVWVSGEAAAAWFPPMAGVIRWPAAVVIVMTEIPLLAWAAHQVKPEPLGQQWALAVLALPGVAAGAAIALRAGLDRRSGRPVHERLALAHPAAGDRVLAATALVPLTLGVCLKFAGLGPAVSWAMNGDNRAQVLWIQHILVHGGLSADAAQAYTLGPQSLAAFVSAAAGRPPGQAPESLAVDIVSLAATYLLLWAGIALTATAAYLLSRPGIPTPSPGRLSAPDVVLAVTAAALSTTGLMTGVALWDGFFPAYAGLLLLIGGLALAIGTVRRPQAVAAALLLMTALAQVFYRPLLMPVSLGLTALLLVVVAVDRRWRGVWWVVLGVLAAITAGGGLILVLRSRLVSQMLGSVGSTTYVSPWLLVAIALVTGALLVGVTHPHWRDTALPVVPVAVVLVTVAGLIAVAQAVGGDGVAGLNYQSQRLVWLGCAATAWVVLLLFRRTDPTALSAALLGVATLAGTTLATTAIWPLQAVATGWPRPTPETAAAVLDPRDAGEVVVHWLWSDGDPGGFPSFGDDRIGLFWSTTLWGDHRKAFLPWPYGLQDGSVDELCPVLAAVPGVEVRTRDPQLSTEIEAVCGMGDDRVTLVGDASDGP